MSSISRSSTRHERDAADADSARGIDDRSHLFELDAGRRGDEQHTVGSHREDRAQAVFQIFPGDRLSVDLEREIRTHGNDHVAIRAVARTWGGLWTFGREPGRELRLDLHEDD